MKALRTWQNIRTTETAQFISPDTPDYLAPDTIGGVDLYAYCRNNPVMYYDPSGHGAILALILGTVVSGLISGVTALISKNN